MRGPALRTRGQALWYFLKKSNMGTKNAELEADFESVEKVAK